MSPGGTIGRRQGRYHVYIVQCQDGTFYTGATHDLDKRLALHNAGRGAKYVRGRGPVRLVYAKAYRDDTRALQAERALKQLTRTQKAALIRSYGSVNMGGRGLAVRLPGGHQLDERFYPDYTHRDRSLFQ